MFEEVAFLLLLEIEMEFSKTDPTKKKIQTPNRLKESRLTEKKRELTQKKGQKKNQCNLEFPS